MLESLTKKQKIIFVIILLIMIIVIIYYIYSNLYSNDFSFSYHDNTLIYNNFDLNIENDISNIKIPNTDTTIVVYICGAVKESKVITLQENSRICDAIDKVGGLTDEADLTNINLAYILEDGEKIYVPKKGENIEESAFSLTSTVSKININKATQTELETIPGIGPSTALKIINYRKENGKFSNIEDIKNISGIGEAKFESIKEYICIK